MLELLQKYIYLNKKYACLLADMPTRSGRRSRPAGLPSESGSWRAFRRGCQTGGACAIKEDLNFLNLVGASLPHGRHGVIRQGKVFHVVALGTAKMPMRSGVGVENHMPFVDGEDRDEPRLGEELCGAVNCGKRDGGEGGSELLVQHLRRRVVVTALQALENGDTLRGDLRPLIF